MYWVLRCCCILLPRDDAVKRDITAAVLCQFMEIEIQTERVIRVAWWHFTGSCAKRICISVFRLLQERFFALQERNVAPIRLNLAWRSRPPNVTLISAEMSCGAPKLKILPKFRNIYAPRRRIPYGIFKTKFSVFVGSFMRGGILKLEGFAQGVSELWGFKFNGVRFTPNLEVPERYGPSLSSRTAGRAGGGRKSLMF